MIYLDNNASTRPAPEVSEVICRALDEFYGNPSSGHIFGRQAKAQIEQARKSVADLIGAKEPGEIYFTSGATEANNIAIFGAAALAAWGGAAAIADGPSAGKGHIISQQTEHPAVLQPLKVLQGRGFEITLLPVDGDGVVSLAALEKAIRPDTVLVTIMHANNETGVIQPIREAVNICREKNKKQKILFHADAAQSVGKIPVDAGVLGVDMLSIAAHKFYGPKGIGALYIKRGVPLENVLMFGAGHEKGMRPGTENTPYIAGLGKACELAGKELPGRMEKLEGLRDMLRGLLAQAFPRLKVNGGNAGRLPNTLNVSFPGVDGSLLVEALKDSVAISAGSACHEGKRSPSSVLKAMGASDDEAFSSVRITLGRENTETEIKEAAALLQKAALQLAQAR